MYSIARLHRYILYILRLNSSASHKEKCFISNVCMLLADCARVLSDHPPAHAGKTPFRNLQNRGLSDHPRTCGENPPYGINLFSKDGSPPHMRGKLTGEIKAAKMMRITPRTCGENFDGHDVAKIIVGSPPHMRGKPSTASRFLRVRRITPAHAGKTRIGCIRIVLYADHPRTCGENEDFVEPLPPYSGSPPHMRGKRKP